MISSVLVANRGEIARRIFRTCRDLCIATVAVHSDADSDAVFVREADRAVRLPGNAAADTYLRGDLIIDAARRAGADAIHPGYGFLSENADFAQAVQDAGLTWIGPNPDTIAEMGSKIRAKELMKAAGVPILEVDPDTASPDDFPLLVKASSGGGGRGMRVVTDPADLAGELAAASAEAQSAFGDDEVFAEPYLPAARHVEVQVMADTHGTIWIVGDRDCSIQRRHQKVVEEAPAPQLSDQVRETLHQAARTAAEAVDYIGAGTVEFLVDDHRVFFLEMNTRLQVEHPVTEQVFGVDLVAEQLSIADGGALGRPPAGPYTHAIEVRIYAEDPADNFAPQTGTVRAFDVPEVVGIRTDSAVEAGSSVGIHYDSMIAKIIATGSDRADALRRLVYALKKTRIHGVGTNQDLLLAIAGDEAFVAGELSTRLLDDRLAAWLEPSASSSDSAVAKAALAAALAQAESARANARVLRRIPTAFRNVASQPRTRTFLLGAREITVSYLGGRPVPTPTDLPGVEVGAVAADRVTLIEDQVAETFQVAVAAASVDVDGLDGSFSFEPVPSFVDPADVVDECSLLAPMPATVVSVAVGAGDAVSQGQTVMVIEAMKMQHPVTAPIDGVVTEIGVTSGAQIESGAVLAVIETNDEGGETP